MDLHIHTCLSPCAQPEMLPTAIIKWAKDKGLDVVGICDHNSAENVLVTKKVGKTEGVRILGGMEICSSEEVHILALRTKIMARTAQYYLVIGEFISP